MKLSAAVDDNIFSSYTVSWKQYYYIHISNEGGRMNDQTEVPKKPRRTLLGLGLLIPAYWTKPVVNSVLLPAHAQTSPGADEPDPDPEPDPECKETKRTRLKAGAGLSWDEGVGANDCITSGFDNEGDGDDFGVLSGDEEQIVFTLNKEDCEIVEAAHKAGQGCVSASISGDGTVATFTAQDKDISHIEIIVECCVD